MARLILLNGAPGSGKSTLARRYASDRPLTLCLDLDVLRSMLGGWLDQPIEAALIARQMAIEAARIQLGAGRDVIVPQYLGRLDFVQQLDALCDRTGAAFVEVVLLSDPGDVAARFRRRSATPESSTHVDAARLLERGGGIADLAGMIERLNTLLACRPRTISITTTDGDIDGVYAALDAAVDAVDQPPATDGSTRTSEVARTGAARPPDARTSSPST